jgi:dienelactone hydrolase
MTGRFVVAAAVWVSGLGTACAQTLEVKPSLAMVDERAVIRASGLQPNERVSIRGELVDRGGHKWASMAEFIADGQGTVDVSKQAPVKGSYTEVSALGLVWSMKPSEKNVESYEGSRELAAQTIQFQLLRNGQAVANAQLEQRRIRDGMRQIKLEGLLHGVLFLPAENGRHPGALVVGGSEGGEPRQKAAWLATHGYAALALGYFHEDGLPSDLAGIPLEYFGLALGWMRQRPELLPDRIAVVGTSRGGELALQLGSMYPQIAAVVAYVPANVRYPACCGDAPVPYAWTWKGQPLAYVPVRALRRPDAVVAMSAAIAVEQTRGPILLISGQDDGVWDSSRMVEAVVLRLKQAHFAQRVEHVNYPHAGHRAGRPEIVPTWHGAMRHPVSGRVENLGGSPKGDAESSIDGIERVLTFLRVSLQTEAGPAQ